MVVILERSNWSTIHPSPASLVVDNIGNYGIISHQPVGRLVKYIFASPGIPSSLPTLLFFRNIGWGIFIIMTTKKCSKCEDVKPVAEFYKNKRSSDGHRPNCKKCHNKATSQYQQQGVYKNYKHSYDQENKCNRREYHTEYRRNKYRSDSNYKLQVDMRRRMREAINGNCKADTTKALLGCTYEEARAHIEAQFTEGMSWDKMGMHGIHIDHIRPCASFDLSDPEQQRECFHYTNLQPLWAKDNLEKSDKW